MSSLVEIGKQQTNKIKPSGFLEIYENYFKDYKDSEIKILEIGIDKGASLRLWREYFSKATICGLDIEKKGQSQKQEPRPVHGDEPFHPQVDYHGPQRW